MFFLKYDFEQVILSILYLPVYVFTSVKEKNRLISNGIYVLLFDALNWYSLIQLKK